ncbi:methylmalonyl-CoA mutase family protein [Afifella sp. H1R]|uniref:methylmalonyl-CoA mutase family protein n=1 Tax=Afifella sp. H1R TaxID=2908841 RepID=UPI001F192140|nr:methylmalonyl-CoA mutase family protein [Afifella sp. H1R]MCF1505544.1 methylmalonyl-CoA mutase family protein [Afifella sp. H1R]
MSSSRSSEASSPGPSSLGTGASGTGQQRPPLNIFPQPAAEDWRTLADKALKGAEFASLRSETRDGISIEPLYPRAADAAPIAARSGPWRIVQRIDHPEPTAASRQALADLSGGADGLALVFAGAPSAAGFGLPESEEAIATALEGVELPAIHLRLEPGADAVQTARRVAALVAKMNFSPADCSIAFGIDPIGRFARFGGDISSVDFFALAVLLRELETAGFAGTVLEADGRIYHSAGASEAQELAAVVATIAGLVRGLAAEGLSPGEVLPKIGVTLAAGHDQFATIGKFRAVSLLTRRLGEVCGVSDFSPRLHGETASRMMMAADAHNNLIRTTIAAFSAAAGGAQTLGVLGFSSAHGLPDRAARRYARNIQHLLMAESGIHHLDDPAAGSGAVEALTDALCEKSWAEFQAIEAEGGILKSLIDQAFTGRIAKARKALLEKIADGASPFVGATLYPNPKEPEIAVEASQIPQQSGLLTPLSAAEITALTANEKVSA